MEANATNWSVFTDINNSGIQIRGILKLWIDTWLDLVDAELLLSITSTHHIFTLTRHSVVSLIPAGKLLRD